MGVAVVGEARPHSVPPGAHGGNLDINLVKGVHARIRKADFGTLSA